VGAVPLSLLAEQHVAGGEIGLDTALSNLSVPLHSSALRYHLNRGMVT